MEKENNKMVELSDEELLDMVGGYALDAAPKALIFPPILLYGIRLPFFK